MVRVAAVLTAPFECERGRLDPRVGRQNLAQAGTPADQPPAVGRAAQPTHPLDLVCGEQVTPIDVVG